MVRAMMRRRLLEPAQLLLVLLVVVTFLGATTVMSMRIHVHGGKSAATAAAPPLPPSHNTRRLRANIVGSTIDYVRPTRIDTDTFTNGFLRCPYFVNHYDVNKQDTSKRSSTDSVKCPTCVHLGRRFVRMLREEYQVSQNTTNVPLVFEQQLIGVCLRHFIRQWCSDVLKPTTVGCCALAKSLSNEYAPAIIQLFSETANADESQMCTKIGYCSSMDAARRPVLTDPSIEVLPTSPPSPPRVLPTPSPTAPMQKVSQEELIRQASGIE